MLEKGSNEQKIERKRYGQGGTIRNREEFARKNETKNKCKTGPGRQVEWGIDESSENDDGWEADQGDIPLLPLD